jgi:hypothetical protein
MIILLSACCFVLYFLPSLIAYNRRVKNRAAILVINAFLGLTLVFWVLSLAWAVAGEIDNYAVNKMV